MIDDEMMVLACRELTHGRGTLVPMAGVAEVAFQEQEVNDDDDPDDLGIEKDEADDRDGCFEHIQIRIAMVES